MHTEITCFFQEPKIQVQMKRIPSCVVDVRSQVRLPICHVNMYEKSFVLLQSLTLCEAWWLEYDNRITY